MARTKADVGKKAGGKSSRKAPALQGGRKSQVTKPKSRKSTSSKNRAIKRGVPSWQKSVKDLGFAAAGSSKDVMEDGVHELIDLEPDSAAMTPASPDAVAAGSGSESFESGSEEDSAMEEEATPPHKGQGDGKDNGVGKKFKKDSENGGSGAAQDDEEEDGEIRDDDEASGDGSEVGEKADEASEEANEDSEINEMAVEVHEEAKGAQEVGEKIVEAREKAKEAQEVGEKAVETTEEAKDALEVDEEAVEATEEAGVPLDVDEEAVEATEEAPEDGEEAGEGSSADKAEEDKDELDSDIV